MGGTRSRLPGGCKDLESKASPLLSRGLAALIRLYQKFVSPILPAACRFHPTCSEYTRQAVLKWGVAKGVWLGLKRIARCHPWNRGGIDPVP